MLCKKCNAELMENSSFCHICGKSIKDAKVRNRSALNIYTVVMLMLYGIAALTCFICNLAVNRTLSWFFIVLVSLMISFSITNLPWILKEHRSIISAAAATLLIYLLLFVCCIYAEGDWLLSFAYPIATFTLIFAWLIFVIIKYIRINWGYKMALISLFSGIFVITCNPIINYLLGEYSFMDSFVYYGGAVNYLANEIIFFCLIAGSIISAIIGIILSFKDKVYKRKNF